MSESSTRQVKPAIPTEESHALHQEALKYLPAGISRLVHSGSPHPIYALEGAGCTVTDVDGNQYLDFYNNASSLIHGHAHPEITRREVARAEKGVVFSFPSQEQIELARLLNERVRSVEHVQFANSGSEAVMFAVKAARAHTGRHKIAKFEGLYHGSYDWVEVSLDSSKENMGPPDSPTSVAYDHGLPPEVLSDVIVLPFNDSVATRALLEKHQNELAAVLVDVMPNQIGLVQGEPEFLLELRDVTAELGIVLICDEVINFRRAYNGGQGHVGFDADVTTFGKIIGGGFPIGALGGSAEIMTVFDTTHGRPKVPHAGTFNANPVTLVGGIATLELLTEDAFEKINRLGALLRERTQAIFDEADFPAHVTGDGSLFRIHMTDTHFSDYRSWRNAVTGNAEVRSRQGHFYNKMLENGIILNRGGMGAISTPMSDQEINQLVGAVHRAVEALQRDE